MSPFLHLLLLGTEIFVNIFFPDEPRQVMSGVCSNPPGRGHLKISKPSARAGIFSKCSSSQRNPKQGHFQQVLSGKIASSWARIELALAFNIYIMVNFISSCIPTSGQKSNKIQDHSIQYRNEIILEFHFKVLRNGPKIYIETK